mmetsp:Transcript_35565/g.102449  ORF Transcript_35565/g.102449 Transcript_35565/m.102449 type:complete len:258 (+) Transcript_35565:715-1488(+)
MSSCVSSSSLRSAARCGSALRLASRSDINASDGALRWGPSSPPRRRVPAASSAAPSAAATSTEGGITRMASVRTLKRSTMSPASLRTSSRLASSSSNSIAARAAAAPLEASGGLASVMPASQDVENAVPPGPPPPRPSCCWSSCCKSVANTRIAASGLGSTRSVKFKVSRSGSSKEATFMRIELSSLNPAASRSRSKVISWTSSTLHAKCTAANMRCMGSNSNGERKAKKRRKKTVAVHRTSEGAPHKKQSWGNCWA